MLELMAYEAMFATEAERRPTTQRGRGEAGWRRFEARVEGQRMDKERREKEKKYREG
jgi:hypothetical protein